MPIIAGQITGSALTASVDYTFVANKPSGIVSGAAQVAANLPAGTVSSSGQVDYNSITNKLSGVVSSSTQIQPLLPEGTVSASDQVSITATTGYSTFSSSIATKNDLQDVSLGALNAATGSYAINATIQGQLAGVASSSAQVKTLLPADTVSSSGQVDITATTGYSTFSSSLATVDANQQIEVNALKAVTSSYAINATIQGQLANVVSSSTQVKPLLPGDTVTSSAQVKAFLPADTVSSSGQVDITATTGYSTFSSSLATVDVGQTTRIDNLASLTSSYAINSTIQGQLAGVVSSSTQVQPLLPSGTVSSSGQVSITATTGYSTFSSSIATKNDIQDISIGALNATTSSYAINATIQGQLASVVSSSTQVKPLLPGGTVSASEQVDITATTNYSTFSSSLATVDVGQTTRIDNLASLTSSYAINSTIQSQLANVVSSSTQVKPLLPDGTVSASGQVVVQNTTGIGALATTGSNVFTANQTITGSLFISQNLTVLGSSSISYISQSTLNVGTNVITMNTNTPGVRLGGIEVIDSGSSPLRSGSLYFDSINDQWIFVHQNTAGGTTSSVLLVGPATFNNIGNETLLTQNKVLKGAGLEHVTDSQITDNGVTVSITNGLSVGTNLTASNATITGLNASQAVFTDANDQLVSVATTGTGDVVRAGSPTITGTLNAANITATGTMLLAGILSQSSQVSITGTTGYSTFSSSIATKNDLQDVSITALNAATSSYAINATIQNQLAGVASSSAQVKTYLPDGSVSSSAQYPGWVTASSQIDYNSITNKLSGVISSSTQVKPLLPTDTITSSAQVKAFLPADTVSSSGQVSITGTTGYSTFSSSIATKNDLQDVSVNALNAATSSYAINTTIQNQLAGVASSSTQVKTYLPGGSVSSSAQYPGWVTASSQIDYNSITNKLSGVVSASAQVQPLLPGGTVSSSGQVSITSTTGYSTFSSSIATKNDIQDISINALSAATSSYAINATIQGQLAGVVSSSTQVKPLLPGGTISSSAQYPGWVTASSQIDYNSITNKLSGVYSSSAFTAPSQGTARLTLNGAALTDVDLGLQADDRPLFSGSQFSGIVSGSGLAYRLVVPVGTNYYAT